MPSAFNEAAKLVIEHWRENLAEGSNEEVLHLILDSVLPDEVTKTLEQFPDDPVALALSTLLDGPHRSINGLSWRPSVNELRDIVGLVTLPGEAINLRVNELTQLQRIWVYYARRGLLFMQHETPGGGRA